MSDVLNLVRVLMTSAFDWLFRTPFFMFPFSFGHLLSAIMVIELTCIILKRFLSYRSEFKEDN